MASSADSTQSADAGHVTRVGWARTAAAARALHSPPCRRQTSRAAQRARVAAGGSSWGPSGAAERALYKEITDRVEQAMLALQEEALEEYCETYGVPEFVFTRDDEAKGGGEGAA